jgi:hypothetical protein
MTITGARRSPYLPGGTLTARVCRHALVLRLLPVNQAHDGRARMGMEQRARVGGEAIQGHDQALRATRGAIEDDLLRSSEGLVPGEVREHISNDEMAAKEDIGGVGSPPNRFHHNVAMARRKSKSIRAG